MKLAPVAPGALGVGEQVFLVRRDGDGDTARNGGGVAPGTGRRGDEYRRSDSSRSNLKNMEGNGKTIDETEGGAGT
jgi:hypothetical protein